MTTRTTKYLDSRAIWGMFYQQLEERDPSGNWAFQVAHYNPESDQELEEYAFSSAVGPMQEWIGPRNARQITVETLQVRNVDFELTLDDKKSNFRFDKTGQMQRRISEMITRSDQHWRKLLSELIQVATTTATYDGSMFFAADHEYRDSGVNSNLLSAGADPSVGQYSQFNVAAATNPTAVELAEAILTAINHMYSFTDDVGEPLNEDAMQFLVMVPTNMSQNALVASTKQLLNSGSGSLDNPLQGIGLDITIQANPRLRATADRSRFQVFRTDGPMKPFVMQQQQEVEHTQMAEGSDYEHTHNRWQFGLNTKRQAALFAWHAAVQAVLS